MKKFFQKLIIIVSILVGSLSISFAQTDSATGKIYFLGNPKGFLEKYRVIMDSKHLCDLSVKHYFVYNAQVGEHFIAMDKAEIKSNEIAIIVEESKSYYIQFYSQDSYGGREIVAKRIPEDLAKMILPSLKQEISCAEKDAN